MKAKVRLDHQLLAIEREHEVHVMLELSSADSLDGTRPALNLALVLDRSGSMGGDKIVYAKRSAAWLLSRLLPTDRLALVDFDDSVRLLAPFQPISTGNARTAINRIGPGGSTNLSGGWLKGVEELRRAPEGESRKVLVLTDGLANVGITEPGPLVSLVASAFGDRIGTTTIGYGSDFDEGLLTAMADAGGGNAHYAETADAAPAIFAAEFDGLTSLVAQNVSVEIRPEAPVDVVAVLNEYPQVPVRGGVQVTLGDAHAGDRRRVVLALHVPRLRELGVAKVADLVVRYVSVGEEVAEHTLTVPVAVNLVSAAEAASAAPDLEVTEEVHVLKAARARDDAIKLADAGDYHGAQRLIHATEQQLRLAGLQEEADALDATLLAADSYDAAARKQLHYSAHMARRRRH